MEHVLWVTILGGVAAMVVFGVLGELADGFNAVGNALCVPCSRCGKRLGFCTDPRGHN